MSFVSCFVVRTSSGCFSLRVLSVWKGYKLFKIKDVCTPPTERCVSEDAPPTLLTCPRCPRVLDRRRLL